MKETFIHPTALVEPGVKLGQGVSVGPFCHIQSGAEIGDNSVLMSHVVITDAARIGAGAKIYPHAVLGCDPQNNKHKGGPTTLVVGRNCNIREGVTMHRGSDSARGYTTVGDDCSFLAYAHVAHDCDIGDHVTFSNNVMIGGHTTIGHHAILGGGAAVHQFVRIGHHAFVGGMAAVVSDLIPYGMAIGVHAWLGGLNIIGMKRSGMVRKEIHNMRHAVRMLFDRSKPVRERAKDVLAAIPDSPAVADMIAFVTVDTKRAYCTPPLDAIHGEAGHDDGDDG
ncbi:MAG: acyl-ACP--UDP-N-acetylglucosamine O-acyltransferase [Rhizobiales bacterium]|nr:acyl-ACP--UDP-N-acetylglucosamine O-acyltransferase [Hyphomicrobiales bacterium]OJX99539.1 MAG: acyl-[acyl-carrier-protein]--UDP-N-acetylglucosamine O-acyltransferase [Rhizobiales bacterium 63-22]